MTDTIVTPNPKNYSSLNFLEAAKNGDLQLIEILVDHGVEITREFENKALSLAAQEGHLEVIKYLMKYGRYSSVEVRNALINAAAKGHLDVIKYLVEQGVSLNAIGEALSWAVFGHHREIIKYLVDQVSTMQMKKVFVIMDTCSTFIGVYSCHQKAQQVVDRMEGEYFGKALIIEERPLDDFLLVD